MGLSVLLSWSMLSGQWNMAEGVRQAESKKRGPTNSKCNVEAEVTDYVA